jgi:ABC-2 type transport system ATP-binding protein
VVLLDEPASGMDPNGRADLKKILRGLAAAGRTVLVSSHILSEMSEFCTSIGIMERGRMVVSGKVEAVAAQVLGHSARLHVEVLGPPEMAENLLRQHSLVGAHTWQGSRVELRFSGGSEDQADLLADLLKAGVRVVSFGRLKEDLEQIFLEVGAKELS